MSADAERASRLSALLDGALELPETERRAYLASECDDESLVAEALELLGANTDGARFTRNLSDVITPRAPYPSGTEPAVDAIGPYQIESILGEGGMGRVYLARQSEPVERKVAIKVMRTSLAGDSERARFLAERQALARLSHANIAQMYDAGATEEGHPYFAMEWVDGPPITTFCDGNRLGVTDRLTLFLEACRGVQHAHQKQVLHRDLKPSNILVTAESSRAVPKLIDFGIAKGLDRPLTGDLEKTRGLVLGTPGYTSPETLGQGDGEAPDTRTDVYALGILLYELLVGERPYDGQGDSVPQIYERIARGDAEPPSRRLAALGADRAQEVARRRGTGAVELRQQLRGDLDGIVLKAISKAREERYDSVSSLAADLERHLRHEPVSARAPTRSYLFRKFVRRNRVMVTAAAAVVAALLIGLVIATAALVRAQRAQRSASELSVFLAEVVSSIDSIDRWHPGEVDSFQFFEEGLELVRRELADDPARHADLLHTLATVFYRADRRDRAQPLVEEAVALRQSLYGASHRDTAESRLLLGTIHERRGAYAEAEEQYRVAAEGAEAALGADDPFAIQCRSALAGLRFTRREPGAEEELEALLSDARRVMPDDAIVSRLINTLAWARRHRGDAEGAAQYFRLAIEQRDDMFYNEESIARLELNLAGALLMGGEVSDAERHIESAITKLRRRRSEDHWWIANARSVLGTVRVRQGRFEDAERLLVGAYPIVRDETGEHSVYTVEILERQRDLYRAWGKSSEIARVDALLNAAKR